MTDMAAKKLEPGSDYNQYDTDGDGVVTDDELETSKELQELKISNERAQAQRSMSWFALWGMLLYPSLVVVSSWAGLVQAASILGDMLQSTLFQSQVYWLRSSGRKHGQTEGIVDEHSCFIGGSSNGTAR